MTATLEQVQQAFHDVVTEFGPEHRAPRPVIYEDSDFTERGCRYVIDDEPSCIAAQVVTKLGLADIETMREWDGPSGESTGMSIMDVNIDATPAAVKFLYSAQIQQDAVPTEEQQTAEFGAPWGEVQAFLERTGSL